MPSKKLKNSLLEYLHSYGQYQYSETDMEILKIYMILDDIYIVKMKRDAINTAHEIIIEDKVLLFEDTNTPVVYKGGKIYELRDAYFEGILTPAQIETLEDVFKKTERITKTHFVNIRLNSHFGFPEEVINEQFENGSCNTAVNLKPQIFFYACTYQELSNNIERYKDTKLYGFTDRKENFINLINEYDESFFRDNILIYYFKTEG